VAGFRPWKARSGGERRLCGDVAKTLYKLVKPLPSPEATARSIANSIRKELEPIRKAHADRRNAVVRDFDHRPEFDAQIKVGQKGIELKVILKNDRESIGGKNTIGDLVKWLFETGTPPHDIPPKRKPYLIFQWGGKGSYSRKVGIGGARGTGEVSGAFTVRSKGVKHPGFQPSKALQNINKQLGLMTNKAIRKGFLDGFNRAKKSSR
jgi:hypothetical protein